MSNFNRGVTAIALGSVIGTIGDLGLASSQWLTAVIAIVFGFALIVNGFIFLSLPQCKKQ